MLDKFLKKRLIMVEKEISDVKQLFSVNEFQEKCQVPLFYLKKKI